MLFCQHFHQPVLHTVRILILVHHDVAETVLILHQHGFVLLKETDRIQQKIVKVHGVIALQLFLISLKDVVDDFGLKVLLHIRLVLLRRHGFFLAGADDAEQIRGAELLVVNILFLEYVFYYGFLIGTVVDDKVMAVTDPFTVHAQDSQTHGVEGHDPHVLAPSGQFFHPAAHLRRSLVGKGHGQYIIRGNSLFDHISDSAGHRAGLARSGAGQNQQWSVDSRRCFPLFIVKSV